MGILFNKQRPKRSFPPSWRSNSSSDDKLNDNLGDELVPTVKGNVVMDVVNDFPWTLTPFQTPARIEAPYIYLREFYQLDSQLNQSLKPYGKKLQSGLQIPVLSNPADFADGDQPSEDSQLTFLTEILAVGSTTSEFLKDLFTAINAEVDILYGGIFDLINPTGFEYKLPFFTEEYFNARNNWTATDILDTLIGLQTEVGGVLKSAVTAYVGKETGIGTFLQNLPTNIRKIQQYALEANNPTVGLMDPPYVWSGANKRTYTFTFPLYNVNFADTNKKNNTKLQIAKNWEFCFLLTYQNLVNKRNFYTGIPPVFYEVLIPGIHYCKASYISDLKISNIGNIRLMSLPIKNGQQECEVNVPDAYSIEITLTDFLQPSKNLLEAAVNTTSRAQISAERIQ